jgi:hypothetical protein
MPAWTKRTVIQTFDPNDGSTFIEITALDGALPPLDPLMPLVIDGKRRAIAGPRHVELDTAERAVTITITVIPDDERPT